MKKSYDFGKAKRGAVLPSPSGKTRITIRLDDDVLEWFRKQAHAAGGGSYQGMINQALRNFIENEEEPLEETLRRVLEDVLPASKGTRKSPAKPKKKAARKRRG